MRNRAIAMNRGHYTRIPIIVMILLPLLSLIAFGNKPVAEDGYNYIKVILAPGRAGSWNASIEARLGGIQFSCKGVVAPQPYYRETRAVSASLLVAPFYYVLDSVCPSLTSFLATRAKLLSGNVTIEIRAPRGYFLYTSMDARGLGDNGSYMLSLKLFANTYVFDGIILASEKAYAINSIGGLVLITPRGAEEESYNDLASAIRCVSMFLREELGPSNRSPVALVIASPLDHPLMLSGIGYSLGGVIYVKPGHDRDSLVHLVAHEAVHSWVGKGRLGGSEDIVEGAAELLSLLALQACNQSLYKAAMRYETLSQEMNPYNVWLRLHAAIRLASLQACGKDLYISAVRSLYKEGVRDATILTLLEHMRELAKNAGCLASLEYSLGKTLLVAGNTSLWSLVSTPGHSCHEAKTTNKDTGKPAAKTMPGKRNQGPQERLATSPCSTASAKSTRSTRSKETASQRVENPVQKTFTSTETSSLTPSNCGSHVYVLLLAGTIVAGILIYVAIRGRNIF